MAATNSEFRYTEKTENTHIWAFETRECFWGFFCLKHDVNNKIVGVSIISAIIWLLIIARYPKCFILQQSIPLKLL